MPNEIRAINTSFLITANRNGPCFSAKHCAHQCKMSAHINGAHWLNDVSL